MMENHIIETKIQHFDRPFRLESGDLINNIEIAYETYGELNPRRDNAILIEHALSGSALSRSPMRPMGSSTRGAITPSSSSMRSRAVRMRHSTMTGRQNRAGGMS
jgi:hypothetical protein